MKVKLVIDKVQRRYFVNGKWIDLGTLDCAGDCGCTTYGPLDGSSVYCYLCGDIQRVIEKSKLLREKHIERLKTKPMSPRMREAIEKYSNPEEFAKLFELVKETNEP